MPTTDGGDMRHDGPERGDPRPRCGKLYGDGYQCGQDAGHLDPCGPARGPTGPTAGEDEATAREFLRVAFGVLRRDGREVYVQRLARLLATTRQAAVESCAQWHDTQGDQANYENVELARTDAAKSKTYHRAKIHRESAAALRAGAGSKEKG